MASVCVILGIWRYHLGNWEGRGGGILLDPKKDTLGSEFLKLYSKFFKRQGVHHFENILLQHLVRYRS